MLQTIAWITVVVMALLYAPLSANALYHLWVPGGASWLSQLFNTLVSEEFGSGRSSLIHLQRPQYEKTLWSLSAHTLVGALLMLIGPLQFSDTFRNRWPSFHRLLGQIYLLLVLVSQATAFWYLAKTPADRVISGFSFAVLLGLLVAGTVLTAIAAYAAIVNRDIVNHKRAMAMNFALLLSAPSLRYRWALLGRLYPDRLFPSINLAANMFDGAFWILLGLVGARMLEKRTHLNRTLPTISRPATIGLQAVGLAALLIVLYLGDHFASVVSGELPHLVRADDSQFFLYDSFAYPFIAIWLLMNLVWWYKQRTSDHLGAFEWQCHTVATAVSPIVIVALWTSFFQRFQDPFSALLTSTMVAWPICLFYSYAFVHIQLGLMQSLFGKDKSSSRTLFQSKNS